MPRHNRQSMSFGAVLAGPFGERDAALDIDPRALNEATGHRKRLRIECENADPLCGVAVADAYGEPQVWLAVGRSFGFGIVSKRAEKCSLDRHAAPRHRLGTMMRASMPRARRRSARVAARRRPSGS